MTHDPRQYPLDWRAVVVRVRERDGERCAWCGAHNRRPHPRTGSQVVLTTAHLCRCRDREGRKCGDLQHLARLCQSCHLAYDRADHVRVARERRHDAKAVADLFPDARAPLPPRDPLTAGPARS